MIKAGIVGATGYTGIELFRLLDKHPDVTVAYVFSTQHQGTLFSDFYPHLDTPLILTDFDLDALPDMDVLFLATPHAQSHQFASRLMKYSFKIIDLSADFRLDDPHLFESYYGVKHAFPEGLSDWHYGIPELSKNELVQANYVSSPGCYALSIILGLFPFSKDHLFETTPIIDSKSGVSGAGRGLNINTHFCEAHDSISSYATGVHRHCAEIESTLGVSILFSPHLVPMSRGILSTIYIDNSRHLSQNDCDTLLFDTYGKEPFIKLMKALDRPSTKYVTGSNVCMISCKVMEKQEKIVIFSMLDNLIKGSSGHAIQLMNLMFRLPETQGLSDTPLYL